MAERAHERVLEAVQDPNALDEIELFAELMAVATAAEERLSQEVIDRVLRVGRVPAQRTRVPAPRRYARSA